MSTIAMRTSLFEEAYNLLDCRCSRDIKILTEEVASFEIMNEEAGDQKESRIKKVIATIKRLISTLIEKIKLLITKIKSKVQDTEIVKIEGTYPKCVTGNGAFASFYRTLQKANDKFRTGANSDITNEIIDEIKSHLEQKDIKTSVTAKDMISWCDKLQALMKSVDTSADKVIKVELIDKDGTKIADLDNVIDMSYLKIGTEILVAGNTIIGTINKILGVASLPEPRI